MDTIKAELNNKKSRNSREEQINSDPIQILFERPGTIDLSLDVIDFKKSNTSNGTYLPKFIQCGLNSSSVSSITDGQMSELVCGLARTIVDDITRHHDLKVLGIIDPHGNIDALMDAIDMKSKWVENKVNSISNSEPDDRERDLGDSVSSFDCTGMWVIACAHPDDDGMGECLLEDQFSRHGLVGLDCFLFLAHKFLTRNLTSPYNQNGLEHLLYAHEDKVRAIVSHLSY